MIPRLKAGIFVRALIRRAEVAGAQAYVARKGSEEAGAIFLKISRLDGTCTVLNQARNGEGELVWARPLGESVDEEKARAYFERQVTYDSDLWIVEIEDRQGRAFVDEPISVIRLAAKIGGTRMTSWFRFILYGVLILAPGAALAGDAPLDDAAFTAYMQRKLQLYSPLPVTVTGPLKAAIALPSGVASPLDLSEVHAACVREPAKCDGAVGDYVQMIARALQKRAAEQAAGIPQDQAGFMAYAAAHLGKLMPDSKVEADGFTLEVTRPGGRAITLDGKDAYQTCAGLAFRCDDGLAYYLARLRDQLVLPAPAQMRVTLHVMDSCNVIASVGNSIQCKIVPLKDPMAPFFRRAFANLEEICFKQVSLGSLVPMTNADRHDLGLDIGEALDLCDKSTHEALGPLAAPPPGASGIGVIKAPLAASHALYPADWSALAAGGHLLIAVPNSDTLLYSLDDSAASVAALGARAAAALLSGGFAVSGDVYRWTGDGWSLATAQSTMNGGPRQTTDVMPRVH